MEEWLPDSGIKMSGKMAGNKESMVFCLTHDSSGMQDPVHTTG